jgi:hypothetical protein
MIGEDVMWREDWDFVVLVLTGMLVFGAVGRANDALDLGDEGWTSPAQLEHAAEAAPSDYEWPSPARIRRAAGITGSGAALDSAPVSGFGGQHR